MFYELAEDAKPSVPDTKEAEALAASLNHSAERVQTLWFSFLIFMLYLAIATGTTTHRMLFLESPLNLPVLNISLPLLGFYILTPIIFVTFHFYMLLNLVLLARTAKSFEDHLVRAFPEDGEARENFRMRIENTLFVQLLVGGRLEREGINAKLLSLMAMITLAVAPAALLLYLQIKFLPYHSEWITWLHRGLLAVDLVLVWTLWPGYRSGWGVRLWPKWSWWLLLASGSSAVALAYAVLLATFPDEQIYLATDWPRGSPAGRKITPVNTLDLDGEDLIDDAKKANITENESSAVEIRWIAALSLTGRDLTGANLESANVRHVDFTDAILNRANFKSAWAEKAHFNSAQLHRARLSRVHLQGASLDRAKLQGTSLIGAKLQGANLFLAELQGASLGGAHLQGSFLGGAQLQGASLKGARLQGASLDGAKSPGSQSLLAELQGASLGNVQLHGTCFELVCTWRTDTRQATWKDTWVSAPKMGKTCGSNWTAASFAALKKLFTEEVPEGIYKRATMEKIEGHLNPTKVLEGENEMTRVWAARERESPAPEAYIKSLAGQWRELGCAAEGAPYVLDGLVIQLATPEDLPVFYESDAATALANDFLDEANCPGAHGLSKAAKAVLNKIAAQTAPQAPEP